MARTDGWRILELQGCGCWIYLVSFPLWEFRYMPPCNPFNPQALIYHLTNRRPYGIL